MKEIANRVGNYWEENDKHIYSELTKEIGQRDVCTEEERLRRLLSEADVMLAETDRKSKEDKKTIIELKKKILFLEAAITVRAPVREGTSTMAAVGGAPGGGITSPRL